MQRSGTHPQRASSRGRRAPWALVVTLAVAACVLVLPAMASAKVDKSHAKAYAATIKALAQRETTHEQLYNAYVDQMIGIATEMEPLLGSLDPDDQATVAGDQAAAGSAYTRYATSIKKMNKIFLDYLKTFYATHRSWFSSDADQIKLQKWSNKYTNGLRQANAAFEKIAAANMALSDMDVAAARARNNEAVALIKKADPAIQASLAGLRALQR